jgi:hypothetical protein
LCKLLGVDAIISGKTTMSKTMSEGAAIAVGLLVGAWGNTNKATAALTIHDGTGDLMWKYDHDFGGSVGSSAESLTHTVNENASKNFRIGTINFPFSNKPPSGGLSLCLRVKNIVNAFK